MNAAACASAGGGEADDIPVKKAAALQIGTSANQVKGTLTRTTDSSGNLVFPANWDGNGNSVAIGATVDYDWAYKIEPQ